MYMTFFRNQGTGLRTPFTDPSNGDAVNDAAGLGFAVNLVVANALADLLADPPGELWRAPSPQVPVRTRYRHRVC